jgi:hypothetical protein
VEEIDEVVFWLQLIADGRLVPLPPLADLQKEPKELLAIFAASQHTAKHSSTSDRSLRSSVLQTDERMIR